MNKFVIIGIVLVVIIGGGLAFKATNTESRDATAAAVAQGQVREFTIIAKKDQWEFAPSLLEAEQGDIIKMRFINEDEYDHGVQIDAYGVSQRIPAASTLDVEPFTATKIGDFQFLCSVSCGEGVVDGKPRGHFDQVGTLRIHPRGKMTGESPTPTP